MYIYVIHKYSLITSKTSTSSALQRFKLKETRTVCTCYRKLSVFSDVFSAKIHEYGYVNMHMLMHMIVFMCRYVYMCKYRFIYIYEIRCDSNRSSDASSGVNGGGGGL